MRNVKMHTRIPGYELTRIQRAWVFAVILVGELLIFAQFRPRNFSLESWNLKNFDSDPAFCVCKVLTAD